LSVAKGITVLNSPATIDAGYRGPLKVNLINHGAFPVQILVGDRIAQMRLSKVPVVTIEVVTSFDETVRGAGAFGSTGR
jgi:dUTP pyrophosphatase